MPDYIILGSNHKWFACYNWNEAFKLAKEMLKSGCEYVKIIKNNEITHWIASDVMSNPALYPEPEYGFKLDENKVYCVLCGNAVGHKHGNSYCLSSESEGDEKKGYCHTCVVEHCLATNCLGCDWYQYPSCPHIETKKLYQESTANK